MHFNQEMLDYRNGYSRNKYFWCGNGALEGHWTSYEVTKPCFGVCPLKVRRVLDSITNIKIIENITIIYKYYYYLSRDMMSKNISSNLAVISLLLTSHNN